MTALQGWRVWPAERNDGRKLALPLCRRLGVEAEDPVGAIVLSPDVLWVRGGRTSLPTVAGTAVNSLVPALPMDFVQFQRL